MTPAEGKKRIQKLLGPKTAWRDNGRPSSEDERAAATERAKVAKAEHERLQVERDELKRKLLSDPTYVALAAATKAAYEAVDQARGWQRFYRITVGTTNSMFFTVEAEGDNWADVVRKLEAKRAEKVAL